MTEGGHQRALLVLGAINGFLAVALGAFGAHGLSQILEETRMAVFETAVRYHAWHALALLATGLAAERFGGRRLIAAGWLFTAGLALFCGSLYALTFGAPRWLGPITPLGGGAFLAGWATLTWGLYKADLK